MLLGWANKFHLYPFDPFGCTNCTALNSQHFIVPRIARNSRHGSLLPDTPQLAGSGGPNRQAQGRPQISKMPSSLAQWAVTSKSHVSQSRHGHVNSHRVWISSASRKCYTQPNFARQNTCQSFDRKATSVSCDPWILHACKLDPVVHARMLMCNWNLLSGSGRVSILWHWDPGITYSCCSRATRWP